MIYVIRLGVHDGSSAQTLYIGTDGYNSRPSDTPANQNFRERVALAGSIERHMFSSDGISGGKTGGQFGVATGTVNVKNGRLYGGEDLIDDWINYSFRTIQIESLIDTTQALSQSKIRFIGTVKQLVSTSAISQYDLPINDRLSDLDRPLLINSYLGTTTAGGQGTADGDVDLKDQTKAKLWGTNHNVACTIANAYDLIYQVSDGAVSSIVVYDGGVGLTNTGDFGSISAMLAATVTPGQYCTCLTLGLFHLGGNPAGLLTADVVEGSSTALRTAGQIASRMMAWFQSMYPAYTVSMDAASVTALDVLNSAECGIRVEADETALSAFGRLLNSVGAYLLPKNDSASVFIVGRFDEPTDPAVATYDIDDSLGGEIERIETGDEGKGIPAYKIIVKYDHLGVVQKSSDVFGVVQDNPSRVSYLSSEWRQAIAQNTGLLVQWPQSPTITSETCMVTQAAAEAEAARLLALYSVRRDCYRIRVPMSDDPADDPDIGDTVELISRDARLGLGTDPGDGKNFVCIGRTDDFEDFPTITLILWG